MVHWYETQIRLRAKRLKEYFGLLFQRSTTTLQASSDADSNCLSGAIVVACDYSFEWHCDYEVGINQARLSSRSIANLR